MASFSPMDSPSPGRKVDSLETSFLPLKDSFYNQMNNVIEIKDRRSRSRNMSKISRTCEAGHIRIEGPGPTICTTSNLYFSNRLFPNTDQCSQLLRIKVRQRFRKVLLSLSFKFQVQQE